MASEPHFFDHLDPVWHALPDEMRGTFWVNGQAVQPRSRQYTRRWTGEKVGQVALVCSYYDMVRAREAGMDVVIMEHGIGQTYLGAAKDQSYIGGSDRDDCLAVLVPNERGAAIHRRAYPSVPVFVVGCPKLDLWLDRPHKNYVAISFHWAGMKEVPESTNALDYYAHMLPTLDRKFKMLGHAHPRGRVPVMDAIVSCGIPFEREFERVVDKAELYVCDNSSTIYEFAALDRPVVVLNAPHFRKGVPHGGRFWEWADVGIQVDRPDMLVQAISIALADPPEVAQRRRAIVKEVYGDTLGHASTLVAEAIQEVVK